MTRNRYFRSDIRLLVIAGLAIFLIAACSKPQINFVNALNTDNNTSVVVVDTFNVAMSTVYVDSFPTAGSGTVLLGRYNDPYFGTITAGTYLQVSTPAPLPTLTPYSVYDSLALVMRINKTFYGDTSRVQTYNVYQLSSLIQLADNQLTYYNFNSFPHYPALLGTGSVQINPTAGYTSLKHADSLYIRLPDSKGQDFFRLLYNQSDTVKTLNAFLNYFNGLAILPDTTTPGAIYGFRDSVFIRMYYHEPGIIYTNKYVDFPYNTKQNQFNNISFNRAGTPTAPIDSLHNEVSSANTGHAAYLQSATGLYTKLLFPNISNLLLYQDYLSVLKAELTIKVVNGTYSPLYALPPQVSMAYTNEANLIGGTIPTGTGGLVIDYVYGANTQYSYDITGYIRQRIIQGADYNSKNGIILNIPTGLYNTTFNRAVFGDQSSQSNVNKISLKIYYASYH